MQFLLIPLHKDVVLHNAHSMTVTAPKDSRMEEELGKALDSGDAIEFSGISYFVDEEIKVGEKKEQV